MEISLSKGFTACPFNFHLASIDFMWVCELEAKSRIIITIFNIRKEGVIWRLTM